MMSSTRKSSLHTGMKAALLGASLLALQGCGMIYKTTGDVLMGFGSKEMLPYMMSDQDTRVACAAGEAQTPLLLAFERVGSDPNKLAVLMNVVASSCTDELALEQELRYLRAGKSQNIAEAPDARIMQKRYAAISARRQYASYQRLQAAFPIPEGENCSKKKLKTDFDELAWMIGNIGGMQAMMSDSTADGVVGVPRDIAARVERGIECIPSDKWWGVPRGVRAAIWNIVPMYAPANADPWAELDKAVKIGNQQGVRLGGAMYVLAAYTKGDNERARQGIRDFAANNKNLNAEFRMMDVMAETIVIGISDRMWTEATGKRTPVGGLGTFWDDAAKSQPSFNIDDLL